MTVHLADHVTFRDQALTVKYTKRRIPMGDLVENYLAENLDFKGDVLAFMEQREELVRFSFTPDHVKFFFTRFIPEVAIHSKKQDARIVRDHYDRGNDFFNWFLGPTMVYTCGFFTSLDNDLEAAQRHKLDLVAHKLQLKAGESHLDIGCGWGTLILHSATHYGTDSTGITIAERQTEFANDRIAQAGMSVSSICKNSSSRSTLCSAETGYSCSRLLDYGLASVLKTLCGVSLWPSIFSRALMPAGRSITSFAPSSEPISKFTV
jgi:hypothetical protein